MNPLFPALIFVGSFLSLTTFAQSNFTKGYIIKNNGDSINGYLRYRNRIGKGNICVFRENKNTKVVSYSSADIRAFGFIDNGRYESKMLPVIKRQVFVEILVKGTISFYSFYDDFYVGKEGQLYPIEKKSSRTIVRNYIETLNELISDCGLTANKTKYDKRQITNLIQNYNRCKGHAGATFDQNPREYKISFQLFGGIDINQMKASGFDKNAFKPSYSQVVGAGMDFFIPQITSKLLLTAEVSYLKRNYEGYKKTVYNANAIDRFDHFYSASFIRVPIGMRYNFLKEAKTPYVKIGLVQYFVFDFSGKVITEEENYGTVMIKSDPYNGAHKNQQGFWIAAGYSRILFSRYKGFVEFRFEKSNGLLGGSNSIGPSSTNLSILAGIRL